MPYAWTNGFRTWFAEAGQGPPVVFVHGHTFDSRMWRPQIAALRDRYRTVVYDLRGHGRSEVPASGYWSTVYASDLRALLDALGLERVTLVGNSVGGSAVVELALASPDRVAALVLADSGLGFPPRTDELRDVHGRMWEITAARGILPALEQVWLPSRFFDGARRRPEVFARVRRMCLGYSGQGFRDPERAGRPMGHAHTRLAELRVPCLAIYGELEGLEVHHAADELLRVVPTTQRFVVPASGHLSNLEEPELFNRELQRFLEQVPR